MADMLDSALLWYGAHRRPVNVVLCVAIISLLYVSVLKEDAILHSSERQKQQTAPVPRRNILEAPSEIFVNLLRKMFLLFLMMNSSSFYHLKKINTISEDQE